MKFPIGLLLALLVVWLFGSWFYDYVKENDLASWVYFAVCIPVGFAAGWIGGEIDHG